MDLSSLQPTTRFSDRVQHYAKSRPRYPQEVLDFLKIEIQLEPSWIVADVGAGTGILSELFLKNGNQVYGVEPNAEMRNAATELLKNHSSFIAIDGTAEKTNLPAANVHAIAAGQAFHWFQRERAKLEFKRILRGEGWVVLLWNGRISDADRFQQEYEKLLRIHGKDYAQIDHRNLQPADFQEFFAGGYRSKTFPNFQLLDFEGLKSRVVSSSYMPSEGKPGFDQMMEALRTLFHRFEQDDQVVLKYETRLHYGQL